MAPKSRNRATLDADAVARMLREQDEVPEQVEAAPPPAESAPEPAAPARVAPSPAVVEAPPAFDPGKVDGRTLRRTGREPFATRIKPETHETLKRIAYTRRITIAEALEQAVAAFDSG